MGQRSLARGVTFQARYAKEPPPCVRSPAFRKCVNPGGGGGGNGHPNSPRAGIRVQRPTSHGLSNRRAEAPRPAGTPAPSPPARPRCGPRRDPGPTRTITRLGAESAEVQEPAQAGRKGAKGAPRVGGGGGERGQPPGWPRPVSGLGPPRRPAVRDRKRPHLDSVLASVWRPGSPAAALPRAPLTSWLKALTASMFALRRWRRRLRARWSHRPYAAAERGWEPAGPGASGGEAGRRRAAQAGREGAAAAERGRAAGRRQGRRAPSQCRSPEQGREAAAARGSNMSVWRWRLRSASR